MFKRIKPNDNLIWIDAYIQRIKPYVHVRTEDNILIKKPNKATKLNNFGAFVLSDLLNGTSIYKILKKFGKDKEQELNDFMLGIKNFMEDRLDVYTQNPAVQVIPFDLKFSKYPVLSEIALTYKCNLKCKFCYAGCNCTVNPVGNNNELSEKEFQKIIDKIYKSAKVPSVSFTGGEPTLSDKLPGLIKYAKKLDMRVNLITNGTQITKDYAKLLKKSGLHSVQISLEGITEDTHDFLVGIKGSYQNAINAVGYMKEQDIHVHTNTTLTKLNIHESSLFPKFIKEKLGLDKFSMNLIIPTGSTSFNEELVIEYSKIGIYLDKILEESKRENVEFMWYSPVPMCMFNSVSTGMGNKGCAACDGLLSVAPDGSVLPCASFDQPVGNLMNTDFETIWQSKEVVSLREKNFAHDICKNCENFNLCNGGCPLYWRAKGYDELYEHYNKINKTA